MRVVVVFVVAACAAVLGGCYKPSLKDCTVTCATASDCAGGQICGADGMCAAPEIAGTCAAISSMQPDADTDDGSGGHDAATRSDAPPHDARMTDASAPACGASCPGTCQGSTCVIDCSKKGSCQAPTICPAGVPCRITCGDGACKNIDCSQASSCTADCKGPNSCEVVTCGDGACDLTCSGKHSCRMTDCHDSCACELECTGDMSCTDGTSCPAGCAAGDGCTSAGACDQC